MFKQSAGGMLTKMAEAEPVPPLGVENDPNWQEAMAERRSIADQMRVAGKLPGQQMYAEATADLEANAPNTEGDLLKQYAYDITQGTIQMIPALA